MIKRLAVLGEEKAKSSAGAPVKFNSDHSGTKAGIVVASG